MGNCKICGKDSGKKKTCGKACFALLNRQRFQLMGQEYALKQKAESKDYIEKNKHIWIDLYTNGNLTIRDIVKKTGEKHERVRNALCEEGLTKSHSKLKLAKQIKNDSLFREVNIFLNDESWIEEKINLGWGGKEISDELKCSPNYVVAYLRNAGRPLIKRTESNVEVRFKKWLDSYNISYIDNTRKIIAPYELDVVIEDKKVAIEIDGVYWHSIKSNNDKNYHKMKTDMCEKAGYRLLHIFDCDIESSKTKDLILNSLSINQSTLYARKLKVENISPKEYTAFCVVNHMQKSCNAKVKLGLRDKDGVLFAVMSFGKARFSKHNWEMIRYCVARNYRIVGGSNKLFSHFLNEFMKDGESMVSYCDRKLFTGNMYLSLGFSHSHDTPPGYLWINENGDIKTRYQCQKHKLKTTLSESEYMQNLKYHKIYDSGQRVFVFNK